MSRSAAAEGAASSRAAVVAWSMVGAEAASCLKGAAGEAAVWFQLP